MSINKHMLEKIIQNHNSLRSSYYKEVKSLPKGNLISCYSNSNLCYYHAKRTSAGYVRKGIGKNPQLIRQLARKEYLLQSIKTIENNLRILNLALEKYTVLDPNNIISTMSRAYKSLPAEYFADTFSDRDSEYIRTWLSEDYNQSIYLPEKKIHTTSRGLRVRSKSELIIAEKLYEYDIPFRYEEVIQYGDKTYAPDFTGLYVNKLPKVWYWEHCGITSDPSYMQGHHNKIMNYEKLGIVPWDNLIVTYDNPDGTINTQIIESEIKNKILSY